MSKDDAETTEPTTSADVAQMRLSDMVKEMDKDAPPDTEEAPETTEAEPAAEAEGDEKPEDEDKGKKEEESFSAIARRAARARRQAERERAEIAKEREAVEAAKAQLREAERAAAYARALANETSMVKRAKLAGIDIEKLAEELGDTQPEDLIEDRVAKALTAREREAQEAARRQAAEYEQRQAQAFIDYANTPACADLRDLATEMGWNGDDFVREAARIERVYESRGVKFKDFSEVAQAMRKQYKLGSSQEQHANGQRENPAAEQVTASKPGNRGTSLSTSRTQRGGDLDDEIREGERTGAALRRLAGL